MCGIAGIAGKVLEQGTKERVLRAIEHRGPDAQGVYEDAHVSLAHTRLSIIDLSPAAEQPMKDQATGVVMVYNGEIYNYRELKLQLHGESFRSQSDTEVILRLYLRYGIVCVEMLQGMFAFAIWDPRSQTLHLCRDRLGIKPLYYHYDDDTLIFSSEIKGLIALGAPVGINLGTVYAYLKYGYLSHTNETFFDSICSLEPATVLSLSPGQIRKKTYWSPLKITQKQSQSRDIEEELWELFKDTLRLHLVSDVPIGISLSSGLDSQFMVRLLSSMGQGEFHTFTFGYHEPEYDEIIRVQNTKFSLPLKQHYLRIRPEEVLENLGRAINFFEMPLGGLGTLSAYQLMRVTRDAGIKVVLSGEGADELFGGYKYYYYAYFRDLYESGRTDLLRRELDAFAHSNGERLDPGTPRFQQQVLNDTAAVRAPDGTTLGKNSFIGQKLRKFEREDACGERENIRGRSHVHTAMLRDLIKLKIPKLLWFQDRASMARGVETRVPFLDHKVVEFAFNLPAELIIRDGISKYLPKRLLQRFGGIDYTDSVKHYVATPQREWLKGPLYQDVLSYLDHGCLAGSGLVDYAGWKKAYADYAQSPILGNSFFVWKMINLEALLRTFFQ